MSKFIKEMIMIQSPSCIIAGTTITNTKYMQAFNNCWDVSSSIEYMIISLMRKLNISPFVSVFDH